MTSLDGLFELYRDIIPRVMLGRTIFFDESNNIRKGTIGVDKDNNDDLENLYFTLGGIATKKRVNFQQMLDYIGAKQIPADAKHFALVDILDSLIEEADANKQLQSDMTEVLYDDFDLLHKILVDYEFPNIPKCKANNFIKAILDLYTTKMENDNQNSFTKEMLRQIIKAKRNKNNLVFLEENQLYVISELPSEMYLARMYNFIDEKLFDNEPSIETKIRIIDEKYETKLNAKFCDSADWREIQISDAISGFVGRMYNFLSKTNERQILNFVRELDRDSESFKTFFDLMTKSNEVSKICFMKTIPLFVERRFDLLYAAI